jgi:hypothetical protein
MTNEQKQHLLAYHGYYVGPVDGIIGSGTREAVKAFQRDYFQMDNMVDGIVGPETEKALAHAVCYGMPARKATEEVPVTGTFWDGIKHFTREEFKCKCGGKYCNGYPAEMREEVVRIADEAREFFNARSHVVSGLRCSQHNANEGGVWNSQHQYGEACDLRIEGVSADRLLAYIKQKPGVRYSYKINDTNVHYDIPQGVR